MKKGAFITIEGCEGVGKSTQTAMLKNYFESINRDALFLREPGGTDISEKIRSVILDTSNVGMSGICEALLYSAARAQLIEEVIAPALAAGRIIVCDRFTDSTFAYQGCARNLGEDVITRLNDIACCGISPDITIFLDLEPEAAFKRKGGADTGDRLECAGIEFHRRVYEGYLKCAKAYPSRFRRVDASSDAEVIHREIIELLKAAGVV
ncbi:MAG: dTMP kinase [Clostridia bacterium]|nr:dTMP kinase [Clostridia bacterium]